jgi:hypothetical protein
MMVGPTKTLTQHLAVYSDSDPSTPTIKIQLRQIRMINDQLARIPSLKNIIELKPVITSSAGYMPGNPVMVRRMSEEEAKLYRDVSNQSEQPALYEHCGVIPCTDTRLPLYALHDGSHRMCTFYELALDKKAAGWSGTMAIEVNPYVPCTPVHLLTGASMAKGVTQQSAKANSFWDTGSWLWKTYTRLTSAEEQKLAARAGKKQGKKSRMAVKPVGVTAIHAEVTSLGLSICIPSKPSMANYMSFLHVLTEDNFAAASAPNEWDNAKIYYRLHGEMTAKDLKHRTVQMSECVCLCVCVCI